MNVEPSLTTHHLAPWDWAVIVLYVLSMFVPWAKGFGALVSLIPIRKLA